MNLSEAGWPDLNSPLLASMGVRDRDMLERVRAAAPMLIKLGVSTAIRDARQAEDHARLERAALVGRDVGVVNRTDRGHSARQDVEIDRNARDPAHPKVRIMRARRADPLHTLRKHRSITARQLDGAERLRDSIEQGMPALSGGSQSEIHTAPWDRGGTSAGQIKACAAVRGATAGLLRDELLVLSWMIGGGTVTGCATFARMHHQTAVKHLKSALDVVAKYYLGSER